MTAALRRTLAAILRACAALAASGDVGTWQTAMQRALASGITQAYRAGTNGQALTRADRALLAARLAGQLPYLQRFANELAANGWRDALQARAALYATAVKPAYWEGKTRGWPLPFQPGDGTTQCLGHCKCSWSLTVLDGEGNADARWTLHAGESCQTCIARAKRTYRIRDGVLHL